MGVEADMIRASIAMVTYNGEKYVREQIESIQESMGEQDELIISDDGSTDKTIEILKEYEEKDSRIRVIRGPGRGQAECELQCWRRAAGNTFFLRIRMISGNRKKLKRSSVLLWKRAAVW